MPCHCSCSISSSPKIPKDLVDAAKVDGVSLFKTYLHIGLPLSKARDCDCGCCIQEVPEQLSVAGHGHSLANIVRCRWRCQYGSNQAYWGNIMAFAVSIAIQVIIFFFILFSGIYFVQSIMRAVRGEVRHQSLSGVLMFAEKYYRPLVHFTPPFGWLNDPWMVWFCKTAEYHLFLPIPS